MILSTEAREQAGHRVAIIGGGIVGLAHAHAAAKRGCTVDLFERHPKATSASVRNFGMLWPVGQPAGQDYTRAIRSRSIWLELAAVADVELEPCGSLHLAHHDDEWRTLQEFVALAGDRSFAVELLSPEQALARSPAINPNGLRGAMWSETELRVDPRTASEKIALYLDSLTNVNVHRNQLVCSVGERHLKTAMGQSFDFDSMVICSGDEFSVLFPEHFAAANLRKCKLHMLRTIPQPNGFRIGPHLASGLTLRHYKSFEACPSLADVKQRVAAEAPELDRFGIHVMASQSPDGHVVLGDSHEYGQDVEPFDKSRIDEWILRELKKILHLPDWTIDQRWTGIYAKCDRPVYKDNVSSNVQVCTGLGGAGMTLSMAIGEETIEGWFGASRNSSEPLEGCEVTHA